MMIEPHILKLSTKRLLAYYKKHYRGRHMADQFDYEMGNITKETLRSLEDDRKIIKAELDGREHV